MSAAETPRDDHIQDYKDLEGDLARAAKRALKNLEKGRKYDRVLVLGVYWHKSIRQPEYMEEHAEGLLAVFREKYGYEVKTLQLEKGNAYRKLNSLLTNIGDDLDSPTKENLFILYYGGHGGFGQDRRARLWQSSLEDAAESIDWYKLQEPLGGVECDILFLFDCCFAMAMPTGDMSWRKRCEIIGAAGEREKAGGNSKVSFTAALRDQLKEDFEKVGETNAWRLGSIMQSRDYKSTLKSTPQHRRLAEGHASTIPLVPLSLDARSTPSTGASSTSSRTLVDTLVCSDARILFSIKTTNLPKAAEFERMLSLLPPSVIGLEVGVHSQKLLDGLGLFQSNSGLTLLSVPVWFWCAMDSNPAYTYIDVVRSGNFLEEYRIAMQATTSSRYCTRGVQTEKVQKAAPSNPIDFVRIREDENRNDNRSASLQVAFRKNTEQSRNVVPWLSPRKSIFSKPNDRLERKIGKETARISVGKIERDTDRYSFHDPLFRSQLNSKQRKVTAFA